ncbi:hypothetical protein DFH07DRAFT_793791 [Mycena maculata]|uniref:F-box domain-containing protein n=1 Tax=Mycena maculata TaxID=230809 RepID=A0AAD7NY73_9AGAR|nr:hypothetical protein DFH07DRAFT_793791 [Mycena maculata]
MNTNEPPEDPESTLLRSVVSKTKTRLACLDDEISLLKDRLKRLEEERAARSDYHARNVGILSPMRRFPPEILTEIF